MLMSAVNCGRYEDRGRASSAAVNARHCVLTLRERCSTDFAHF